MSTSLTGSALAMPLSDLVQTYAGNRQTCVIRVCTFDADGDFYLENGELRAASFGDLIGDDAAIALLASVDATYEVKIGRRAREHNVTLSLQTLVLESARRKDEGSLPYPSPRPRTAVSSMPHPPVLPRSSSTRSFLLAVVGILGIGAAAIFVVYSLMTGDTRPGAAELDNGSPMPVVSPLPVAAAAPLPTGQVDGSSLVGPSDAPPRLVMGSPPRLPDGASGLQPTVVIRLLVGAEGKVEEAEVFQPRPDLVAFETAAVEAVKSYTFTPARKGGQTVAAWLSWPVAFVKDAKPVTARKIQIKGSDTIGGALGPDLANAFRAGHPEIDIQEEALGSATAFVGLFDGSADIGAASRPVNEKELAEAARLGVNLREWVIGFDGVSIIVNAQNPIDHLTIEQAGRIFAGEAATWKDVGGEGGAFHLIGRPSYSGTHVFFKEKVVRRGNAKGPQEYAPTTAYLEKNEDIVAKVASDPLAIAYVGAGWASGVKIIPVAKDDGSAPVAPTRENIKNGTYPVFRPLLFYTRGTPAGDAAAFLAFVFSPMGQGIVSRHGFVSSDVDAPAELAAASKAPSDTRAPAEAASRIVFAFGAHEPDAAGLATIQDLSRKIGARKALVIGNADSEGSGDRNTKIGLMRAQRVAALLEKYGVARDRMQVESAGSDRPLSTNGSLDGRKANRRVDVFLLEN